MTSEYIDALELTEEQWAKTEIKDPSRRDIRMPPKHRQIRLVTRNQWNHQSRRWVIEQEVNGKIIHETEERISRYWQSPYTLVSGDHYGRGMVEMHLGLVKALHRMSKAQVDLAALNSRKIFGMGAGINSRPEDLVRVPNGGFIEDPGIRVADGKVQNIGAIEFAGIRDMQTLELALARMQAELEHAFMIERQLSGERVTATHVTRVAQQVNEQSGGFLVHAHDHLLIQPVEYAFAKAEADGLIGPSLRVPDALVSTRMTTGLAAAERMSSAEATLDIANMVAMLGPEAAEHIDIGEFFQAYVRHRGISEPTFIKSRQQVQSDRAARASQQVDQLAQATAIETAGEVARDRLTASV